MSNPTTPDNENAQISPLRRRFLLGGAGLGALVLTGCSTAARKAIGEDVSSTFDKARQFVAPTPEEAAAQAQQRALEAAQAQAEAQARAVAARNPNNYIAPSLNGNLAKEIHRQLQVNARLNPQRQLMVFNSVPFERDLKAGASSASNPYLNPNNPNAAGNQVRGRVNGEVNRRLGNGTLGQMGSAIYNSAATAEAVNSKQLATTSGLLVQANNLANSGQQARAYAMVNGILNAAYNVGLVAEPGTQPQSATANGITWQGVQDALGIGSEGAVRNLLPSVGQGGALGDVLRGRIPGVK